MYFAVVFRNTGAIGGEYPVLFGIEIGENINFVTASQVSYVLSSDMVCASINISMISITAKEIMQSDSSMLAVDFHLNETDFAGCLFF